MPTAEALSDLGLTAEDLKYEEQEARELRLKAEVARRSVHFAGSSLNTGSPRFVLEFESLADAAIAQSDDWFARIRVARLLRQEEAGKPRTGLSGVGGGGTWRNQPSDATLPNPAGIKTRDQFRVVRSGSVRYRFEQR